MHLDTYMFMWVGWYRVRIYASMHLSTSIYAYSIWVCVCMSKYKYGWSYIHVWGCPHIICWCIDLKYTDAHTDVSIDVKMCTFKKLQMYLYVCKNMFTQNQLPSGKTGWSFSHRSTTFYILNDQWAQCELLTWSTAFPYPNPGWTLPGLLCPHESCHKRPPHPHHATLCGCGMLRGPWHPKNEHPMGSIPLGNCSMRFPFVKREVDICESHSA